MARPAPSPAMPAPGLPAPGLPASGLSSSSAGAGIDWLVPLPHGLYCPPGDVWIDPVRAKPRAIITHGHTDHARPGHGAVLATPETLAIMRGRFGAEAVHGQPLPYGQRLRVGDVTVFLAPAGHVLGSAQVAIEYRGRRAVISGDYKRRADPTCAAFEPVPADLFVTEATFALPVFRHPPATREIARLLHGLSVFPERAHLVGVYALGKCQRVIRMIRDAGYDRPIHIHDALADISALYEAHGVALGTLLPASGATAGDLKGALVLAPPGAITERWARHLPDPLVAMASGWMGVRARARQRDVELPLVISDHADWDELLMTLGELRPEEVWITHGREDALAHAARTMGIFARPLRLVGYGDEDGDAPGGDAPIAGPAGA
ncbi:ligase-associated DNA damage response exonuclease [Tistrella bauzanensis]|uniref:ligase-associated DNA damage response exonuclease n=1 Tax=Tistrella TaxID=171436 RepID=UPI0031F63FD5